MTEIKSEHHVAEEQGADQPRAEQAESRIDAVRHDIFAKLADAGEEVIAKVAGMPGATRAVEQATMALSRLDELQKRVLGVEALEKRVAELETKVAMLEQRSPGSGSGSSSGAGTGTGTGTGSSSGTGTGSSAGTGSAGGSTPGGHTGSV